ncbi:MAG: hypothetical protein FJY43_04825 [Betaproteobacteria bacterium]|nr:hypothetical protein [Betaproteobacteria bacterium]
MRCGDGQQSSWVIAENVNGNVKVQRADKPEVYRLAPVWAYMLADIYDVLGTGQGTIRMTRLRGPEQGVQKLAVGDRYRFTCRWAASRGEAERTHSIVVRGQRRVATAAFGEQEVFDVVDESPSASHELRREVRYAPELKMFVSFKVRNNRTGFEQSCELVSLKGP